MVSFMFAAPEALAGAASDLAGLGATISAANAAAAPATIGVPAAAADEVSTQIAALFSQHAVGYQQLSAQVADFHRRFVQALAAAANAYASAETSAAQTLVTALKEPAEMLLGHPLGGTGAAAAPAANILLPLGTSIENAYLAIEAWVAYGFELVSYAVGWLFLIGILAPQINYFYYLVEPIVQSVLFNAIDFLDGTVSFAQGLSNIHAAGAASINQFIATENYWFHSLLPPPPPLGVNLP